MKKYHCSNPNCKSVFSEPKVIMYRVCPICQTMIDSTAAIYQAGTVVEEESVPTEQTKTRDFFEKEDISQIEDPKIVDKKTHLQPEEKELEIAKPSITESETKNTRTAETTTKPSPNAESAFIELKSTSSPKPEELKQVQLEETKPKFAEPKAIKQQIEAEEKTIESKSTMPTKTITQPKKSQQKIETKNIAHQSVKNTDSDSSDKTCQYYFGYLGQREKGEGIPSSCVECPKSLDCMLAEYYKSKETVEEIRKWYRPKL